MNYGFGLNIQGLKKLWTSELGLVGLGLWDFAGSKVGALIIRIGFRGALYSTNNKEPPKIV